MHPQEKESGEAYEGGRKALFLSHLYRGSIQIFMKKRKGGAAFMPRSGTFRKRGVPVHK